MNVKIYMSILMILSALLTSSCELREEDKAYNDNIMKYSAIMMIIQARIPSLTDNRDGTLTYSINDFFGNVLGSTVIKKCLQGQVYRLAQNDCQGAGSALDGWGASKLQYCNVDDNTCNPMGQFVAGDDYWVFGPNSQIYTSCSGDTTAGLSWYPITHLTNIDIGEIFYNGIYHNKNSDLPTDFNIIGVWMAGKYDLTKARYLRGGTYSFSSYSANKTSLKYTLCGTYIPH